MDAGPNNVTGPSGTFSGPGRAFGDLSAVAAAIYPRTGSRFALRIEIQKAGGYQSLVWIPTVIANRWQNVQPDPATTAFDLYNDNDLTAPVGTTTLAAAQKTYPTNNFTISFLSWGCGSTAASKVHLDIATFLLGGSLFQYDFDAQPSTTTLSASRSRLTSGQSVTLSTVATVTYDVGQPAVPATSARLQLWRRPAGGTWKKYATTSADDQGRASIRLVPTSIAEYQWRFPTTGSTAPSRSAIKRVDVAAKVTGELLDDRLRKGERPVAVGKATPGKSGATVTLWRTSSTGRTKLGTATVKSNGMYKVPGKVITISGAQTWKLQVTVPAGRGTLAGTSPTMKARIN